MINKENEEIVDVDEDRFLKVQKIGNKKKIIIAKKKDETEKEINIEPIFDLHNIKKSFINWENEDYNRNIPFHVGRYFWFIVIVLLCYFCNIITNFKVKLLSFTNMYNDLLKIIEICTIIFCFGNLTNIFTELSDYKKLLFTIIITMISYQIINMIIVNLIKYPVKYHRRVDKIYELYNFFIYIPYLLILFYLIYMFKFRIKLNNTDMINIFVFIFITFILCIIVPTLMSKKVVRIWYISYIFLLYFRFRHNSFKILIGILIGLMLSDIGTANYFSCNFNGLGCSTECSNCREIIKVLE